MSKGFAAALAAALGVVALAVPAAGAKTHMLVGIQDDSQFLYGNPESSFPYLRSLRAQVLRINLTWGGPHGVANDEPEKPMDPTDPAYDWGIYDRAVLYATQYRVKVLFSIYGTPRWANGDRGPKWAPINALDLQKFAYAAAKRYSGSFVNDEGRVLPPVRYWLAWNEPNNPIFLFPQYKLRNRRWFIQSALDYAQICKAIYTGVHATLLRAEKVACGATGPRGNNNPGTTRSSVSPLAFIRALKAAGLKKFDAFAHHPYYQFPSEAPAMKPRIRTAVTLGNIDDLVKEVTRLWGGKRIWITEYGYQTNPPDKTYGVSYAKQAQFLKEAFALARKNPRIDMMIWFLLRDERRIPNGWQSGLFTAGGKRKPAFTAFASLPH